MKKKNPFRAIKIPVIGYLFELITGLKKLAKYYDEKPANINSCKDFLAYTLSAVGIKYNIKNTSNIPLAGAAIIASNHPLGGAEGVILSDILLSKRNDVKVLANDFLGSIPELSELFIDVDIFSKKGAAKKNINALKEAKEHLLGGGVLVMFPAGSVSNYKNGVLQDNDWSRSLAHLSLGAKSPIVPVFVSGKNSRLFYFFKRIHPILGTLNLGRELLNKKGKVIDIFFGKKITQLEIKAITDSGAKKAEIVRYVRLSTYLLAEIKDKVEPAAYLDNLIPEVAKEDILKEINDLDKEFILHEKDDFIIACAEKEFIPNTLKEIGRLREATFRSVQEGTGSSIDIDEFDDYYLHLFVFDKKRNKIAGAYRLGLIEEILKSKGVSGFYTQTLFNCDNSLLAKMSGFIEMGRSFISVEYQKDLNTLKLLWQGIATFVYKNPKYTTLFGPVSISQSYNDVSKKFLIDALLYNHGMPNISKKVKSTTPFIYDKHIYWNSDILKLAKNMKVFSNLVSRIDSDNKKVPVLIRKYLDLGAKFLTFNLDENFNCTVDGLILVDLTKLTSSELGKYMGEENAFRYLKKHNSL